MTRRGSSTSTGASRITLRRRPPPTKTTRSSSPKISSQSKEREQHTPRKRGRSAATAPSQAGAPSKRAASSSPQQDAAEDFAWVGRALYRDKRTRDVYYRAVEIPDLDDIVQVGDSVRLKAPGHSSASWLARIESLWCDDVGEKWAEVRWYYRPEETHSGRLAEHYANEVFESDLTDENTLDTIVEHIAVQFEGRDEETELDKRAASLAKRGAETFRCRQQYDGAGERFLPLLPQRPKALRSINALHKRNSQAGSFALGLAAGDAASDSEGSDSDGDESRRTGVDAQHHSVYQRASAALRLSRVPKKMPCREIERAEVTEFIQERLNSQTGGTLYISGVPGTGKTATVRAAVRELRRKQLGIGRFQYIEINALRLSAPSAVYSALWEALSGEQLIAAEAQVRLEQRVTRQIRGVPSILLVDEIDYLVTRQQTVIYNLFDWPRRAKKPFIIIAIANTIDLPERLLPRVHSRLGLKRLTFSPYQREEVEMIVRDRLKEIPAFENEAVELCARKVAARSGDVRGALDICRRAAEIAERDRRKQKQPPRRGKEEKYERIGIASIDRAVRELFSSPVVAALQHCSRIERVLVAAALGEIRAGGEHILTVHQLLARVRVLCRSHGIPIPSESVLCDALARLCQQHIFSADTKRVTRIAKIRLGVEEDDIQFALQQDVFGLASRF